MATVEEKQAMVAKPQAELQEVEDDKMVEGLVKDVKRGKNHDGKIIARSVNKGHEISIINRAVLLKLATRLNLQYVDQRHYQDGPDDYCSGDYHTHLILGPPVKTNCDKCPTCGK